jgi:hypothetical protein
VYLNYRKMNFIKTNFKKAQKDLSSIVAKTTVTKCDPDYVYDFTKSQIYERYIPNKVYPDEDFVLLNCITFFGGDDEELGLSVIFSDVKKEISENLIVPTDISLKKEYLQEVIDFYQKIESKILETDDGSLTTELINLADVKLDNLLNRTIYDDFLRTLKTSLRKEIIFLYEMIKKIEKKSNQTISEEIPALKHDIIWRRDKVDLIELVRTLKLIGAIDNSTHNLTYKKAYEFFGKVFNIDLKNPEDLLRQRRDSKDTPYFLEQLLEKLNEDITILEKNRKP